MKLRCSRCRKEWIDISVGRCGGCGLVLGESADVIAQPFGITDDSAAEDIAIDDDGHPPAATTLSVTDITGTGSLRHHGIPEKVPNSKPGNMALTPFEGYLLSLVDGATFVDDVIAASGLALHEAAIALQNLKEKGLIRFRDSVDQDAHRRGADGQLRAPDPPNAVASVAPAALGRVGVKRIAAGTAVPLEDPGEELGKARECAGRGDFRKAREHGRLAAMMAPESQEVNQLLDQLEAPAHAQMRARHLHSLGSAAQKAGDYMRAVEFFRAALLEWEPSAVIHHKLAVALALAGFPMQEAETHLVRACSLAPTNPTYQEHLTQLRTQIYGPPQQQPRF